MHVALVLGLLLLAACQKSPSPPPAQGASKSIGLDAGVSVDASVVKSAAQVRADAGVVGPPAEFTGVVRGVVKLAKGEKLPLAPFPQQNGITPPSIKPCPPVDSSDQRNTVALFKQTGGLSPVHVALTGMRAAPPHEPKTHEVFIDGCRLGPTLLGAVRGDHLRVTNRSETVLIPRVPGEHIARGLLRGESIDGELKKTRTLVDCGFGVWCGETLVVATTHPLFAVTSKEGFFKIEHVPLDQELKVHAWNPLFEVASKTFTLTHAEPELMLELTLTPTKFAAATKLGPPPPPPPPKVIVHRTDAGIIVDGPGPGYE